MNFIKKHNKSSKISAAGADLKNKGTTHHFFVEKQVFITNHQNTQKGRRPSSSVVVRRRRRIMMGRQSVLEDDVFNSDVCAMVIQKSTT